MDIVSAIDQAVGCHSCGGSLEKSVSDLFCSEHCQQAWHAKRLRDPAHASREPHPTEGDLRAAIRAFYGGA